MTTRRRFTTGATTIGAFSMLRPRRGLSEASSPLLGTESVHQGGAELGESGSSMTKDLAWGELAPRELERVRAATLTVENGAAPTILFDDFDIDLQNPEAGLNMAKIFTAQLPVVLGELVGSSGYIGIIRGNIHKTPGSRIILFLELGSGNKIIEWPYGDVRSMEYGNAEFGFTLFNPEHRLTMQTAPQLPSLAVSIFASVQRLSSSEQVGLGVDSLDLMIVLDEPKGSHR